LKVSANTRFQPLDLHFTTTVTLLNTGTAPMSRVDYMRTVDPDQEEVRLPVDIGCHSAIGGGVITSCFVPMTLLLIVLRFGAAFVDTLFATISP
jgi:hypothetical protein